MNEKAQCHKVHIAMFGEKPDQTDGVLHITLRTADTVFGSKENPSSGLVQIAERNTQRIDKLERWQWGVMGAFTVINVIIKFVPADLITKLLK